MHEIFREGWQWANEQMVKFRWWSGSGIRIRITDQDRHTGKTCTGWGIVTVPVLLHRVSKNVPPLANCYNFDAHEWILIFFGRNVTDKVSNQKTLYYATSNNLCFCTIWQNAETRKSHISLNWIVLHTQCTCALSFWKKKLLSVMCLIASNICWGSKIFH